MDGRPALARDFPPLFTLQPNANSRRRQLELWRGIVLASGDSVLSPVHDNAVFANASIGRRLSREGVDAVVAHLIAAGNAEWTDAAHSSLRLMRRTPASVAAELLQWAASVDAPSTVHTLYELCVGDDAPIQDCEQLLVLRALELLEREGRCQVFAHDALDEYGVKFS